MLVDKAHQMVYKKWNKTKIFCTFANAKKCLFMKQLYLVVFCWLSLVVSAQLSSIPTPHTATTSPTGITFNVKNNRTDTVRVFGLNSMHWSDAPATSSTVTVWYKISSSKLAPGTISTGNGWINAGTFTLNRTYRSIRSPFISNLAIDIAPDSTCRIYLSTTSSMAHQFVSVTGTPTTTSLMNVDVITADSAGYYGFSAPTNLSAGFNGDVLFYPLTACSSTPEVGNITSNEGIGYCNGQNKIYFLENFIPGKNITYQWQSATTATGTFANVGTSTTMYTRTATANAYIRCIATCATSGLKDTTPVFADTLKPFYWCYCETTNKPTGTNLASIESVEFATTKTSNTNATCEPYTDYRGLPTAKIRLGEPLKVTMRNKICGTNVTNYSANGWLDLNRNGTFDAGEIIPNGFVFGTTSVAISGNIIPPLTGPTGITGLRLMLQGGTTTPPANPCVQNVSWSEAEDYLIDIIRDSTDAKMNAITGLNDGCELGNTNISFSVTNIGFKAINPLTVTYSVNGGTPVTENFASLAAGATTSYTFSTQANLSGYGTKIIKVWHQNTLDTNKLNDTVTFKVVNFETPATPTPEHDTVCVGSTLSVIKAKSTPPFMTRWYSDAGGTIEVATGDEYSIPNPTTSTVRYAKSVNVYNERVGPTDLSPVQWLSTINQGLVFDVLKNKVRINSVKARFNAAGVAAVEIRSPSNASLLVKSFLVLTANTEVTIPLGIDLPIGTGYKMWLNTTPGGCATQLGYYNFPQQIPNVIRITGNTTTSTPPRYDYFYDWDISHDACSSSLVAVNSVYLSGVTAPVKLLTDDTSYCEYPAQYLDAGNPGATYKWHDGSTGRTKLVTASGAYIVTITHSSGCRSIDTSDVTIKSSPIFSLGNDTTVCTGKSVILKSGYSNAGYNHTWSTGSLEPQITVKNAGTYTVHVFNTNTNCGYDDTAIVSFVQSPNAFLGRDTATCNNQPITIYAPTGNYNYMWDNGTSGTSRTINTAGSNKLWVDITDISNAYGCKSSDTVIVTIARLVKPKLGNDISTCNNPTSIGVTDSAHLQYRWSAGQTTSNINVTESGQYILTITEVNTTCSYSDTVNVKINTNPPLEIGGPLTTCKDSTFDIVANTGWTSYNWSNGFTVNKITVNTIGGGSYILNVTGPCGTAKDTFVVNYQTPVPDFSLPNDTLVCDPITVGISSSVATGNGVLWSTNETTQSITVDKSGIYWVTVENSCGAKSDAIRVLFDTMPVADFTPNWSGQFAAFANKSVNGASYYWEFGDDSTSTQKHPNHRYDTLKPFWVKLTVFNTCGDTISALKLIDLTKKPGSAISSANRYEWTIYPNPTSDIVYIDNPHAKQGDYNIELLTVEGRLVKSVQNKFNANGQTTLDVSSISEGSYLLRLINKDGEQDLKKLSIVR